MGILDRQRYWAFGKAYVICFVALVGLYVVIDAFTNVDEFAEVSETTLQLFSNMGWYYLIKMSMFYDRLCGVITMMAAIFTVTWMQKNNELLAMLAAGISTRRVIRPVLISSMLVSGIAVANQELIMPRIAEDLQKPPDDDSVRRVMVTTRHDSNDLTLSASGQADRRFKTLFYFSATIPVTVAEELLEIQANQARYFPPDSNTPLKDGWLLHNARLVTPPTSDAHTNVLTKLDSLEGFPMPLIVTEDSAEYAKDALPGDIYFLKSDLTFDAMTRSRQWYQFADTRELIVALREMHNKPEWVDIEVFLHSRMIRPLAALALLGISLPIVLGGQGRNMFVNLGLSLLTSGIFYASTFMSGYFGSNGAIPATLAAWIPLFIFGTLAVARWDTIRT